MCQSRIFSGKSQTQKLWENTHKTVFIWACEKVFEHLACLVFMALYIFKRYRDPEIVIFPRGTTDVNVFPLYIFGA